MMFIKNIKYEILFGKKKFIINVLLVSLIIGVLTGLNSLEKDMSINSTEKYKNHNIMDIKVSSDVGFEESDYHIINMIDGTKNIMLVDKLKTSIDIRGKKVNATLVSYNEGNHINKQTLKYGEYPHTINEVVVEEALFKKYKLNLGSLITVIPNDNKILKAKKLKVVGVIEKSDYHLLDSETKDNSYYAFIYLNNFSNKYFTNIYVTVKDNKDVTNYVKELNKRLNPVVIERFNMEKSQLATELAMYQDDLNELYNLDLPQESLTEDIKLASDKVQKAKDKLLTLNNPNIHILRRNNTIGHSLINSIISKYTKVDIFLPFLFIIGILIIIAYETTVMIYDDDNEIKTLRSLGFNDYQISLKYIIYNLIVTLFASITGTLLINKFMRIFVLKKLNLLESIFKLSASFTSKTIIELILIIILVCMTSMAIYLINNKKEEY